MFDIRLKNWEVFCEFFKNLKDFTDECEITFGMDYVEVICIDKSISCFFILKLEKSYFSYYKINREYSLMVNPKVFNDILSLYNPNKSPLRLLYNKWRFGDILTIEFLDDNTQKICCCKMKLIDMKVSYIKQHKFFTSINEKLINTKIEIKSKIFEDILDKFDKLKVSKISFLKEDDDMFILSKNDMIESFSIKLNEISNVKHFKHFKDEDYNILFKMSYIKTVSKGTKYSKNCVISISKNLNKLFIIYLIDEDAINAKKKNKITNKTTTNNNIGKVEYYLESM